jgi:DNA-directed RNA polymerase specialized sigma24 family protein
LALRIAIGLTVAETAHVLGTTTEVVRHQQHRALNRLRALLADPADTAGPL